MQFDFQRINKFRLLAGVSFAAFLTASAVVTSGVPDNQVVRAEWDLCTLVLTTGVAGLALGMTAGLGHALSRLSTSFIEEESTWTRSLGLCGMVLDNMWRSAAMAGMAGVMIGGSLSCIPPMTRHDVIMAGKEPGHPSPVTRALFPAVLP